MQQRIPTDPLTRLAQIAVEMARKQSTETLIDGLYSEAINRHNDLTQERDALKQQVENYKAKLRDHTTTTRSDEEHA